MRSARAERKTRREEEAIDRQISRGRDVPVSEAEQWRRRAAVPTCLAALFRAAVTPAPVSLLWKLRWGGGREEPEAITATIILRNTPPPAHTHTHIHTQIHQGLIFHRQSVKSRGEQNHTTSTPTGRGGALEMGGGGALAHPRRAPRRNCARTRTRPPHGGRKIIKSRRTLSCGDNQSRVERTEKRGKKGNKIRTFSSLFFSSLSEAPAFANK